jgi:DNA-binding MarR family transcriptional regulator
VAATKVRQTAPQKTVAVDALGGSNARAIALINMTARLTNRAARIRLGELGAWPGQIPLLLWLVHKDGLIQKQLVHLTKMEQPTVAEHLNRLEKSGLIVRRRDIQDGRAAKIFLTPKAKAISAKLIDELESGAHVFTKNISKRDLATFNLDISANMNGLQDFIEATETTQSRKYLS